MVSSASEICADLDWEVSMGGSNGFAGLLVSIILLYQVSWRLRLGPALASI